MAASSNTAGQIKYALRNEFDGRRIALTGGAFDTIIPSASTFGASSSGTKLLPYHVFINHCGQDTKKTLPSRIYDSLHSTGLRVFMDKPELNLGDLLPKALEEAMATASICIAIFSEHCAQSPCCLAELEYMVKTHKIIIPIFYHVDISDFRWGKGVCADAFSQHEKKGRYAPDVLQRWKQALQQASCCIGSIINNIDDEKRVVKNVVNRVMKEMYKVPLEVAKHPVGLDEVVQDFNTIALQSTGSTQMVGIWGMGGSGKTTLAKEIFNKRSSAMDRSSFLFDLRNAAAKGILVEKQKRLLEDLNVKHAPFDHVDVGKGILNSRLRSEPVLIVLDDVDHIDQLDALLPPKESLGNKSLIIVTTRNANVLQQWGISAVYPMGPLNATHAKQLFCWHAFLQNSPPSELEDLVEKFLNACDGLPLSLEVLGGQLYGRSDKEFWQRTFNKFSHIPHEDIAKRLKVSYDALRKQDKEMFLDAACLFIGERKTRAIAAWDAEKTWDGLLGWQTLFNNCLVEEDRYGLIRMHPHLRDLGRDIADAQSPYRLWSPQQVIEITPQQEAIRVRGMVNAVGDNCYQQQGKIIINTSEGERRRAPDSLGLKIFVGDADFLNPELSRDLICLQCNKFKHKSLSPWLSLKNLRILEVSDSKRLEYLWEQDADAPLQLRELVIQRCNSLREFPRSIGHLKNLKKILISQDSANRDTLTSLPQEFCHLQSLEHLEIKWCRNLSSLPSNFGELMNLQHVNLNGGSMLRTLPDSFKKLVLLEYLNLEGCCELIIKSKLHVLENMTKLKYLNLNECKKLEELRLPKGASLTQLYIRETSLKELPANIFQLTKLTELQIGSEFLTTLPSSLENLPSLTTLEIQRCEKLSGLPCFAELQSLKIFRLEDCSRVKRVEGLESLKSLEILKIRDCPELNRLPSLEELTSLKEIDLQMCHKLEKIEGLTSVKILKIRGCPELNGLLSLEELTSLEEIDLRMCHKLEKTEGLESLKSLEILKIRDCPELNRLPSIGDLRNLRHLDLCACKTLKNLPDSLGDLSSLETLSIIGCIQLELLPSSIGYLKFLEHLCIESSRLRYIPEGLTQLVNLLTLKISGSPLNELDFGSGSLWSLRKINLSETHVTRISISEDCCPDLETLELSQNEYLEEIDPLPAGVRTIELSEYEILE